METKITPERFEKLLPSICDRETSSDPKNWTLDNPLWGHCAVVSLVAQNLFGGELMRALLTHIPKFAHMRSHYWNRLPDKTGSLTKEFDFTAPQFGDEYPHGLVAEQSTRRYILYDPKTGEPREIMKRYKLLAWRLAKELNQGNPLFESDIYRRCFYNALNSPCQKIKFGAIIVNTSDNRNIIYILELASKEGYNNTLEPLKSLCEPTCIRFNIPSRTESMIGACSHAEENILWEAVKMKTSLNLCDLYVAGIYPNGLPYIKNKTEFTCLRCAVQIYHSEIRRVFVPVVSGWQAMSGEECVETARAYATGEKKV